MYFYYPFHVLSICRRYTGWEQKLFLVIHLGSKCSKGSESILLKCLTFTRISHVNFAPFLPQFWSNSFSYTTQCVLQHLRVTIWCVFSSWRKKYYLGFIACISKLSTTSTSKNSKQLFSYGIKYCWFVLKEILSKFYYNNNILFNFV